MNPFTDQFMAATAAVMACFIALPVMGWGVWSLCRPQEGR